METIAASRGPIQSAEACHTSHDVGWCLTGSQAFRQEGGQKRGVGVIYPMGRGRKGGLPAPGGIPHLVPSSLT